MNITIDQLKHLRPLLNKESKQEIASALGKSYHTVEAVLKGNFAHDEIERAIVRSAVSRFNRLDILLNIIYSNNENI